MTKTAHRFLNKTFSSWKFIIIKNEDDLNCLYNGKLQVIVDW